MSIDLAKTDVDGLLRLYVTATARANDAKYFDDHGRYKHELNSAESAMLDIRLELERRCQPEDTSGKAA